jgi:HD-GYP domain-containing protein (c-di-GMP phosphodiesterase class II)
VFVEKNIPIPERFFDNHYKPNQNAKDVLNMLMQYNAKPRYDAKTRIAKLTAIIAALGIKDPYTGGHARRVAIYARRLAERIGLNPVEAEKIRLGGLLHDIGKIGSRHSPSCIKSAAPISTPSWLKHSCPT